MRSIAFWAVAVSLALAAGCGGAGVDSKPPAAAENMADMKEMLEDYQKQYKKPPAKAADLKGYEPVHPMAVRALQRDAIVYVWGVPIGSGTAVLAYPKDAPEKGGTVLLQDGTLKNMTAAEFAAAPKAGK